MSTIEEIEKAIENLAPQELERFRAWFDNFDSARFDEKIEQDAQSGKLDELAKEALAAHRESCETPGQSRVLVGLSAPCLKTSAPSSTRISRC